MMKAGCCPQLRGMSSMWARSSGPLPLIMAAGGQQKHRQAGGHWGMHFG